VAKIEFLMKENGQNRILDAEKWPKLARKNGQNRILDEEKWPK